MTSYLFGEICTFLQILAMFLTQVERMVGTQSSGILLIYWLLSFMAAVVMFSSKVQHALEKVSEITYL